MSFEVVHFELESTNSILRFLYFYDTIKQPELFIPDNQGVFVAKKCSRTQTRLNDQLRTVNIEIDFDDQRQVYTFGLQPVVPPPRIDNAKELDWRWESQRRITPKDCRFRGFVNLLGEADGQKAHLAAHRQATDDQLLVAACSGFRHWDSIDASWRHLPCTLSVS